MSVILAIETATNACSAALWMQGEGIEEYELAPRRHAELLLPMVDRVLVRAGVSLAEVDAIAFGRGPGGFMGVRLAAGMAQGLAFGVNKPVIGVSTLQALAWHTYRLSGAKQVLASWDARMDQLYWGAYCLEAGTMQAVVPDQLADPEAVVCPVGDWVAVGNAWAAYQSRFARELSDIVRAADTVSYPHALAVAELAAVAHANGESVSALAAEPVYLRDQVTN